MLILNSVGQRTGVMSKIHVWLGETLCTPDEFSQYFEINLADRDVGIHWYDNGLIGGYRFGQAISPEVAADELLTSQDTIAAVLCRCSELGITQANALFYHQDADPHVSDTFRLCNGLPYLSVFENGRPHTDSD